jgi:hypothetical protein
MQLLYVLHGDTAHTVLVLTHEAVGLAVAVGRRTWVTVPTTGFAHDTAVLTRIGTEHGHTSTTSEAPRAGWYELGMQWREIPGRLQLAPEAVHTMICAYGDSNSHNGFRRVASRYYVVETLV